MAANSNGSAPSKQGKRLAQKNYAERMLATLGQQHLLSDNFLGLYGKFSPDQVSIYDLLRMREDPMIKMGLYYGKAPLIRSDYTIKCEDPEIAAGMTEIVRNVRQSWMRIALTKFDFGFQAAVKDYTLGDISATYEDPDSGEVTQVWKDNDVQPVIMKPPIPIPPLHAAVHMEKGQFRGIETKLEYQAISQDDNIVPPEWSLWFTNEFEEQMRNYYGKPRISAAYEPWYTYWFTHHMRSRHIEMDADPALQVWYPPGHYSDPGDLDDDGNPIRKSNRDAALEIGANLRGGATIAWPSDVYTDEQGKSTPIALWRAEFLKGGENLGVFNDVLKDLEVQKLRACLVPEEALIASSNGQNSRASAGTYGAIFTESLEIEALDLDQYMNQHQLRDIAEANWGKDCPKVEIVTTGFQEQDLTLATELIQLAFTTDPNAIPIKWEELTKQLELPTYSAKEQQEREEADAQAKEEAAAAAAEAGIEDPNAPAEVGALPGEPPATPQQLAASMDGQRTRTRKYEMERINLHGPSVKSTAPGWARREGARRDRNVNALAERMQDVMEARYRDAFEAAADALAEDDTQLSLSVTDTVNALIEKVKNAIHKRVRQPGWNLSVQGELASMYHASGAAELIRMGLSAHSWDVGRDEVQEWARERAGELITTIDKTVVEKHIRPWLTDELQNLGIQDGSGISHGTMELAQRLTDRFSAYPLWMAERVVRSEARMGYNVAGLDMYERAGVTEVTAYDGLGGKSGKTDEDCLARNGQQFSIAEARIENENEHPNGTLGFMPVLSSVERLQPLEPGTLQENPVMSLSIYAVTDDGDILDEEATGRALASK